MIPWPDGEFYSNLPAFWYELQDRSYLLSISCIVSTQHYWLLIDAHSLNRRWCCFHLDMMSVSLLNTDLLVPPSFFLCGAWDFLPHRSDGFSRRWVGYQRYLRTRPGKFHLFSHHCLATLWNQLILVGSNPNCMVNLFDWCAHSSLTLH